MMDLRGRCPKMPQLAPTLPPQQELAAFAVAQGVSVGQIAEEVGINRKTLFRWRERRDFKERVENLRHEMSARLTGMLCEAGAEAIDTLRRLLDGESAQIRLQSARWLLSAAVARLAPDKVAAEP